MRILCGSALVLGAFTSASLAEPLELKDPQMDAVTAGDVSVTQSNSNTGPNEGDVSQSNTTSVTVDQSNNNSPPPPPPV